MAKLRQARPNDSRRYFDWLDRAGEDILCANLLMESDPCYNNAAFHCQQAIEKALKAYILFHTGLLPDGHNLTWLCKKASSIHSSFKQYLEMSTALNRCYIETRYPADHPINLGYREILHYYKMACEMYLFICKEVDSAIIEGIEAATPRLPRH